MALRWLRNKLTSHNLYTTVFHTKWVIIKCEDMLGHHYKKFLTPLKLLKEQLLKMLLKLSSKIQTIQFMWNGGQVSSSVTDFQWRKQMVPHLDWTSCLFFFYHGAMQSFKWLSRFSFFLHKRGKVGHKQTGSAKVIYLSMWPPHWNTALHVKEIPWLL